MNNKITMIISGLILVLVAFYGGMKFGEAQSPMRGNFVAFAGGAGGFGGRGARGPNGSIVTGQILSVDSTGVTVKARDGSSRIVFVSPSTMVMKSVSGKTSDLLVGQEIMTIGTANSDGSITAQNIQIRPATTTPNQ